MVFVVALGHDWHSKLFSLIIYTRIGGQTLVEWFSGVRTQSGVGAKGFRRFLVAAVPERECGSRTDI